MTALSLACDSNGSLHVGQSCVVKTIFAENLDTKHGFYSTDTVPECK